MDDSPRRSRRYDDEDDRPRRRPVSDEDEDDRPRRRRPRDEDEDDRPRRRRTEDEEEDRPRRRADTYATKDDEDEPRRPRSRRDEDEEEDRRRERRRRRDEDDEDDEPQPRKRRQSPSVQEMDRRVKLLLWGAGILVVFIGLVAGGIWFAVRTAKRAPFRAQMSTYLAQPVGAAPAGTPVQKVVVVDVKDKDVDSMHFDVPDGLRAATPQEVTTVVQLNWDKRQVGTYSSGGKAYQWFCDVTVVDLKSKGKIGGQNFSGSRPPQSFVGKRGESRTGDKPTEAVLNYIKGLRR
jgi:hypothetical protein